MIHFTQMIQFLKRNSFLILLFVTGCYADKGRVGKFEDQHINDSIVVCTKLPETIFGSNNLIVKKLSHSYEGIKKNNSVYNVIKVNYNIPVYFFFTSDIMSVNRNYLMIGDSRFYLDEVYTTGSNPIKPEATNFYEVTNKNNSKYIIVFAKDLSYNTIYSDQLTFAFRIRDDTVLNIISLGNTKFVDPKSISDYNDNGNIEFLACNDNLDTLYCNEIVNDSLVPLKNNFLHINAVDGLGEVFVIDTLGSNWWK